MLEEDTRALEFQTWWNKMEKHTNLGKIFSDSPLPCVLRLLREV